VEQDNFLEITRLVLLGKAENLLTRELVLVENLFEIFTRDTTYAQDIVDHASGEKIGLWNLLSVKNWTIRCES
jgi:hypothetical protein